jgi:hypothetical protein
MIIIMKPIMQKRNRIYLMNEEKENEIKYLSVAAGRFRDTALLILIGSGCCIVSCA